MKEIEPPRKTLKPIELLFSDLSLSLMASLTAIILVRSFIDPFADLKLFILRWETLALIGSLVGHLLTGTSKVVIRHATYRSISKQLGAAVIKELIILSYLLLMDIHWSRVEGIETIILILDALLTMFFAISFRIVAIAIYQTMLKSPEENIDRLSVMIFGTSNKSVALLTRLETSPHYAPAGFLSTKKSEAGNEISDYKVYYVSDVNDLQNLQTKIGFEGLIFSNEKEAEEQTNNIVAACISLGVHILSTPRIGEMEMIKVPESTHNQAAITTSAYIPDGMNSFEVGLKRFIDAIIAGICLIVFSPLFLYCWIAIRREDHGPAIYSQERIGRFGRPFKIYKFRTMRMDAEKFGPALFAGKEDPRITKIGRKLRAHHLDELPQLWNVFIGDMAFVGPRPERKFYIDQIMERDPRYYYLYQIRPGVTSYATFFNGYCDSVDKMVHRLEYDLYYLRNRSWWFDIKILWKTFVNIISGNKF